MSMSHVLAEGQQSVVPLPEREPAALRAAVARLDPAALARFEADWTAATARARDEYSLLQYVPDAANVVGGLTRDQIDEVESLASRIADAVWLLRVKWLNFGPVMP